MAHLQPEAAMHIELGTLEYSLHAHSQLKVGGAAVLCTLVALPQWHCSSIYTGHSANVDVAVGADSKLWMKLAQCHRNLILS